MHITYYVVLYYYYHGGLFCCNSLFGTVPRRACISSNPHCPLVSPFCLFTDYTVAQARKPNTIMGKMNPGIKRSAYYKRQRGHKRDTCNEYWYYQIKHLRTKTGYFLEDDCYDYVTDARGVLNADAFLNQRGLNTGRYDKKSIK